MTIEERAIKIENEIINLNPQPIYWKAIRMAAIKGATEQKSIDIDKACEWLKEEVTFEHPDYRHAVPLYDDSDIEAFRKYMED